MSKISRDKKKQKNEGKFTQDTVDRMVEYINQGLNAYDFEFGSPGDEGPRIVKISNDGQYKFADKNGEMKFKIVLI